MTPTAFKAARRSLGLSVEALARALQLGKCGERSVRRWSYDTGKSANKWRVPGPVATVMEEWLERGMGAAAETRARNAHLSKTTKS